MIGILEYGAGNLRSVTNALEATGLPYQLVRRPQDIGQIERILLPGVGHFRPMMQALQPFLPELRAALQGGMPLLGICLGMQVLFEESEESPGTPGLGIIPGRVRRFQDVPRVPHMGWNDVEHADQPRQPFYFANSYYAPTGEWTVGRAKYGDIEFSATVRYGAVQGFQFHPEKSGQAGLDLLLQWGNGC